MYKVFDTIGMEVPYRYRNKAQFPVQKEDGKVKLGFYRKKSHDIIDIDKCLIQDEKNDLIIDIIRKYIEEENISIYDEKSHKGSTKTYSNQGGLYKWSGNGSPSSYRG